MSFEVAFRCEIGFIDGRSFSCREIALGQAVVLWWMFDVFFSIVETSEDCKSS